MAAGSGERSRNRNRRPCGHLHPRSHPVLDFGIRHPVNSRIAMACWRLCSRGLPRAIESERKREMGRAEASPPSSQDGGWPSSSSLRVSRTLTARSSRSQAPGMTVRRRDRCPLLLDPPRLVERAMDPTARRRLTGFPGRTHGSVCARVGLAAIDTLSEPVLGSKLFHPEVRSLEAVRESASLSLIASASPSGAGRHGREEAIIVCARWRALREKHEPNSQAGRDLATSARFGAMTGAVPVPGSTCPWRSTRSGA